MSRKVNYCIYFLIKEGKVIYIGQTKDLKTRLHGHKSKKYDSVRYIVCKPDMLNHYETRWIKKFLPVYNKDMRGRVGRDKDIQKSDNLCCVQLVIRKEIYTMALLCMAEKGIKSFSKYVEYLILEDCRYIKIKAIEDGMAQ